MTRWIGGALVFLVLGLTCPTAWAGSPTDDVRALFAGASRIMDPRAPGGLEERLGAVRGLIREAVDFREAARLSLGPTWSARTPAERDEFVPLFAEFVERALIAGIAGKIRLGEGIKVSYLDEVVDGAAATVRTTIASRSGIDLPLDYRMIQRGGRWAIRDVVMDGVSLASNYRAQLLRVMQAASYPELLQQMRARVGASAATPLVASAIPDHTSLDFLALDTQAPLAAGVRGAPIERIERVAPPSRMASTALAASAAHGPAPADLDRAERRSGGQDRGEAGPNARAEDRASDRAHWLALDLTLVARAVPDAPAVAPIVGAPPTPPAEKLAEPARAGELARYGELIDLVARTRSAEPSRTIESPKPAVQAKPREQASAVALTMPAPPPKRAEPTKVAVLAMPAPPPKPAEPTKIAALTMPAPPPKPAARPVAAEPPPLVALVTPSELPRPATPLRAVRQEPEPSTPGRRAADTPSADIKRYWVQVGAFKTVDIAQRLVDELVEQGAAPASSVVVEPASPAVPWARVRVGPFLDRWAAASKVREMQALGHSPFVAGPRD
jgi:phospholipid transport system substrate-binding protein